MKKSPSSTATTTSDSLITWALVKLFQIALSHDFSECLLKDLVDQLLKIINAERSSASEFLRECMQSKITFQSLDYVRMQINLNKPDVASMLNFYKLNSRYANVNSQLVLDKCSRFIFEELNMLPKPSTFAFDTNHMALCLYLSCYYRWYELIDATVIPVFGIYTGGYNIAMGDDVFFFTTCIVRPYNAKEGNSLKLLFAVINGSQYTITSCDPIDGTMPPMEIDRLIKYSVYSHACPPPHLPLVESFDSVQKPSIYKPAYGLFKDTQYSKNEENVPNNDLTFLSIYVKNGVKRKYTLYVPYFTTSMIHAFFTQTLPLVHECKHVLECGSSWNHFVSKMVKRNRDNFCLLNYL
ncbi:hypothetical protein BdWA1_002397 [Babesia duncani]|uniref:Uncharacterized protein n=1 Tax=Babesia duncani TaxID=323732 RepID=A0AAD9UN85_9APIC|nr:hypothetical protein BdWA1_002397 [Babesia duncani]